MDTKLRHVLMALTALLAVLHASPARGGDEVQPAWSPAAAAKYLDGRAESWLGWSSSARGHGTACISCHTTLPFALARPALGATLGETAPASSEQKLIAILKKRVHNWDKIVADSEADKDPLVPFY